MITVSRQPGAADLSLTPPLRSAQLHELLRTANRVLDIAERVASTAAASTGSDVAAVLDAHAWPRLDEARKALEEAMSLAFEIVEEAAAALDKQS
jgi:hypothetical protein